MRKLHLFVLISGLSTDHDLVKSASKAAQDTVAADLEEVRGEVLGLVATQDASAENLAKLAARLNSEETANSTKEMRDRQAKLRTDLDVTAKQV